ncbi:MAG: hypothetical protein IKM31_01260 [Oscillospiraceae bacterium]|nr:hypothetical protein [Oscillospiraceae bacterium]
MKKILSFILAFLTMMSLTVMTVSAEECGRHEAAFCLICENYAELPKGCDWNAESRTLTLDGVWMDSEENIVGIMIPGDSVLDIRGENKLYARVSGVRCAGDLTLTGIGSLQSTDKNDQYHYAIEAEGEIFLQDCDLLGQCELTGRGIIRNNKPSPKVVLGPAFRHSKGSHKNWQPLPTDDLALRKSGCYYLTKDTVLPETLRIYRETDGGTTVNICLNGHSLSVADNVQGSVLLVDGSFINICDCSGGQGKITGGRNFPWEHTLDGISYSADTSGGGIIIRMNSSLYMSGVTVTGNHCTDRGGGICAGGSNIHLENCTITGNTGSGLYLGTLENYNKLRFSGKVIIDGNTGSNFNINYGVKTARFTYALTEGRIGISTVTASATEGNPLLLSGSNQNDQSGFFYSDEPGYAIENTPNNEVQLVAQTSHVHVFTASREYTELYHWGICSCGKESPKVPHVFKLVDGRHQCTGCDIPYGDEEPASEPSSEAAGEPTSETVSEPSSEATGEPSSEQTGEVSSEPTGEPSSEPENKRIKGCVHKAAYCFECYEEMQLPEGCFWDGAAQTLYIEDAYVFVDWLPIAFRLPKDSTVKLTGDSIFECRPGSSHLTAFYCLGDLTLTGIGTLEGVDKGNEAMFMNEPLVSANGRILLKDCSLLNDASISAKNGKEYLAHLTQLALGPEVMPDEEDKEDISVTAHDGHTGWQPFANDGSVLRGNHYLYLTGDTELEKTLEIAYKEAGTTINLCLNGHTLSLAEGKTGSVINVDEATLNICDCSEAGTGTITGGNTVKISDPTNAQPHANPGGAIHVFGGRLNIDGCTITGNKAYWGGGINAYGATTLVHLTGTRIIGNEAEHGSAVHVTGMEYADPYGLVLDGCTISGNKGKRSLSIHAPVLLKDTSITQNEGGVWTSVDTGFIISGNTVIKDNGANLSFMRSGAIQVEDFTGPAESIGVTYSDTWLFREWEDVPVTALSDEDWSHIFFSDDKRYAVRSVPYGTRYKAELYIPPHRHVYDHRWERDRDYHWGICYCGEQGPKRRHFPGGMVNENVRYCFKCERKYAEPYEEQLLPPNERTVWPWAAGAGAVLTVTAVLILLRKRKKIQ